MQRDIEQQLWRAYRRRRSVANRNALVEYYVPDLPRIIGHACPRHRPPFVTDDDVSAASIGLIKAVEAYRSGRAAFRSYLYARVRGAVLDERRSRPVGQEMGRRQYHVKSVPLHDEIEAEAEAPRIERDEDRRELAETILRASSRLDTFIGLLSRQEQRALRLIRFEGMTNQQAARKMRLTKGRVSQLHNGALAKLRRMLLGEGEEA